MFQRFLSLCGVIAPLLFAFMTLLGGALRPGYSHVADTVSELFAPGSPNKPLLDTFHIIFTLLLILFGIGLLRMVRRSGAYKTIGITAAVLFIIMGCLSVTTATVFPQDAWGTPPTLPGKMHQNVSGLITFVSFLYMLLFGIWFKRTGFFPGFATYTFITIGVSLLLAGIFVTQMGTPFMGLAERITILAGFLWIFIFALWMFSRGGYAD